jgi:hypothetical protein
VNDWGEEIYSIDEDGKIHLGEYACMICGLWGPRRSDVPCSDSTVVWTRADWLRLPPSKDDWPTRPWAPATHVWVNGEWRETRPHAPTA